MKKRFLVCVILLITHLGSRAQTYDTTQYYGKMNWLFANVNTAPITTGLLREYGIDFQHLDNYTGASLHDSNYTSLTDWRMLYASLYSEQINSNAGLLYLDTLNSLFNQYGVMGDPISFVGMYYNYQSLDINAVTNGQMTVSNGQIFDVSGRTTSPYSTKEVFAIATTRQYAVTGNNQLIFRSNLFFGNTGKTISSIQVDPKGTGTYQTVTMGTAFTVNYDTAGAYTINIQITYTDNTVKYAHTQLAVHGTSNSLASNINMHDVLGYKSYGPPYFHHAFDYDYFPSVTPTTFTADKAYLGGTAEGDYTITYSINNNTGHLTKPLIILDGFDPDATSAGTGTLYGDLWGRISYDINDNANPPIGLSHGLDNLNSYDLIYLHWHNGVDYIQRNAYLLEKLLKIINAQKQANGVTEQNVVVGVSMGGLIARYALRDMEVNGTDAHDTRLFISDDAPHWGANVPVGYQALVQYIAPWKVIDAGFQGTFPQFYIQWKDMFPTVVDAVNLFNSPAAKQMLIQRYLLQSSGGSYSLAADNSTHTSFMTEINNLGWPLNCKNVTLSNGACSNVQQFPDNSQMIGISGDQSWTYLGGIWKSLVGSLAGIINGTEIPTLGSVPVNNSALLVQFPLSLISTKTNLVFDFGAWSVPPGGVSGALLFKGDIYMHRQILWGLANTTSYLLKCHAASTSDMLALDNAQGGTYDLSKFGIKQDDINDQLHSALGNWVNLTVYQPAFGFIPTVSALAFDNPTQYYRSNICNIINCHNPQQVADYYTPALNQLHTAFTQDNTTWILKEQDPTYSCAKICADNMTISGSSTACTSTSYTLNGAPANATITWYTDRPGWVTLLPRGTRVSVTPTGNGLVTLSANISNSCSVSVDVSKQIQVGGGPSQNLAITPYSPSNPTSYCTSSFYTFTFTELEPANGITGYQWGYTDAGGSHDVGNASLNYFNTYLFNDAGSYQLYVKPVGDCGVGTANIYNITVGDCSGGGFGNFNTPNTPTSKSINNSSFSVFPNPATNVLYVTVSADSINLNSATIKLMDAAGKQLIQVNKVATTNTINVAGIASGVYMVEVSDGKRKFIKKVVKQ